MSSSQKLKSSEGSESYSDKSHGILNERILLIIFNSIKWDLHVLCLTASVSRRLRAVARRLLWKELCLYRAPRMVQALTSNVRASGGSWFNGEWHSLAKLLFFCCGCKASRNFRMIGGGVSGHFTATSRFSKTSGKSFLRKKCWGDLLYVSDPCEHEVRGEEDDLVGIYRGVFRGFNKSYTRSALIRRQVALEERVRCPYCGSRVWNMTSARLVPRTAAKNLGSRDGGLEYFVCLNGHLHGTCWLVPLSSDDEDGEFKVLEDGNDDGDWTAEDGAADESQGSEHKFINEDLGV